MRQSYPVTSVSIFEQGGWLAGLATSGQFLLCGVIETLQVWDLKSMSCVRCSIIKMQFLTENSQNEWNTSNYELQCDCLLVKVTYDEISVI